GGAVHRGAPAPPAGRELSGPEEPRPGRRHRAMESPEVGQDLALGGFAPTRFSVLDSPAWLRSDHAPKSKQLLVDGPKRLLPFPKLTTWDAYGAAIDAEVQSLWKGERRAREVAESIRTATDPILAEHQRNLKAGR